MDDKNNLEKSIRELTVYEKRISSVGWTFVRGITYGLGFFIGSAMLTTVLIYILSKFQGVSGIGKLIQQIINSIN